MAELEKWLIELFSNPARLVAFLIGAGCVLFVAGPLYWRLITRRRDGLEKVERELRTAKAELKRRNVRLGEIEPIFTRLAQEAMLRHVLPERLAEWIIQQESRLDKAQEVIVRHRRHARQLSRKLEDEQSQVGDLKKRIEQMGKEAVVPSSASASMERDDLLSQLAEARQRCEELQREQSANQAQAQTQLGEERDRLLAQTEKLFARISELENVASEKAGSAIDRVLAETERIWERSVDLATMPKFTPLSLVRPPIISVVNLKGGVGKTTITVNLGATWWEATRDVLLIDLDFQASLTNRCLSEEEWEVADSPRHVQSVFLDGVTGLPPASTLAKSIRRITFAKADVNLRAQLGQGHILTASERLADAETRLMVRWLFDHCDGDIRFRLRKVLHSQEIADRFAYVLIDCPPRLTTACVNALAASDYVLIPVLPDDTSTERVPQLLEWLQRFDKLGICSDLTGIGIVLNKFKGIDEQEKAWQRLKQSCVDGRSDRLRFLDAHIRDDPLRMAIAAKGHWPAVLRSTAQFDDLRSAFKKLAQELDVTLRRQGP